MIPRLSAATNEYGSHETIGGQYLVGSHGGWPANYWNLCLRTGYTKNPVVLLGNTPWRYPSSYRRFVRKYTKVESSMTAEPWWPTQWFPVGTERYGMQLLTDYPDYWRGSNITYDENIKREANTKALLKIGSNKAQFGVALLESRKAYQMIAKTTVSLWTAYRHARRGEWKAVERSLGLSGSGKVLSGLYPANKWLEYQYGWKPLLSDLYAAYGVVQGSLKADSFLVFGKGGASRSNSFESVFYDSAVRCNTRRRGKGEQIVVTRLTGKLSSQVWRQAGQVGLINPLSIGWELVPFSFLIDWFMPIGNVLEALTARAGLDFVTGSQTWITGGTARGEHIPGWPPMPKVGTTQCGVFDVTRARLYGWPLPFVYVSESPFSSKRSANALALWRSTLRERVPDNLPRYNTRSLRRQFRL